MQDTAADPGTQKCHTGTQSAHWGGVPVATGKAYAVCWAEFQAYSSLEWEACTNKKIKLCASQTTFFPSKADPCSTLQPPSFGAWFSVTHNMSLAFLIWKKEKTGHLSSPCTVPSTLLMLYSYSGKQPCGYAAALAAQISAGTLHPVTKLSAPPTSRNDNYCTHEHSE